MSTLSSSASLVQNIGIINSQNSTNNTIDLTLGKVSATEVGVLSFSGTSYANIGIISSNSSTNNSIKVNSGKIQSLGVGSNSTSDVEIGVIDTASAQNNMIDVKIRDNVLSESYGVDTTSKINIGRITGGSSASNN